MAVASVVKFSGVAVATAVAVSVLGGCMSVPALRDPVPNTPGASQKTITELLTQWADLTNAAIAATGDTDGWFRGPLQNGKPWDPAAEEVSLPPCGTVGSKAAHQVSNGVTHEAFESDPHPIADKLTAYWESQGFTVVRTVDWADGKGWMDIAIRADRPDGVRYGLTATTRIVAIDVSTESSTDPSIDAWAEEKTNRRLRTEIPAPAPTASPSAETPKSDAGGGSNEDGEWFGF
ncbi:hypothetical protein [Leifsonia sp. 71-9]|uniref:hypothetical protein n=1 Tax=Leifsonia sp. 71-9 TaxID=1895934 RepID=UPI000B091A3E|nr:hypothetical protein [Leifsonia sp. 71-9]